MSITILRTVFLEVGEKQSLLKDSKDLPSVDKIKVSSILVPTTTGSGGEVCDIWPDSHINPFTAAHGCPHIPIPRVGSAGRAAG